MTKHTPTVRLTPARRKVIDALLDQLLDLSAAARAQRMRELARRCPRIHSWLERLLMASGNPTSFLESMFERAGDAALADFTLQREALPAGTRIGDWRLAEPVGAGGMGVVYRAERADGAFEMNVAIKFIRSRDDALMAERLAVETQLLARLDHRNIARVIDGGTLPDGQNYLVMEWIEGEDLADCRERTGTGGDPKGHRCLGLFAEIAGAVAHAHQRQVVHGDIKPANIRIGPDGRPKLLDFGVARLISVERGAPGQTEALTPAFSAPEQLEGSPASTQSDIYALGSLLRWMLTGQPGRHGVPVKPAELDAVRPTALAAVINKASARDPDRRYSSVPQMVGDIRALMAGRPVSVIDYGVTSRIALWARRHQFAAGLAGLALAAVVVGVAGISWQARIAAAERDAARFEAERSTLLREQLVLLFREVGQNKSDDEELSTRELLTESVKVAERLHAHDPQMLVSIKLLLGEIYIAMNDFAGADPLLSSFVDFKPNLASPLLQAIARADLAQVRLRHGDSAEAVALTDDALEFLRRSPARNAARIADVIQIRGQALRGQGRWDDAISTLQEAVRLARTEPAPSRLRATASNNLAITLMYAGRTGQALPLLREALDNWRRLGLEDGSSALTIMSNLASLLHQRGELSEAEPLYREAIRRRAERFGESGALAAAHLNLGSLLATRHRIEQAREHVAHGVSMIERFEGRDSLNHVRAQLARGRVELAAGNLSRAREDLEAARTRFEGTVGPDHLFTAIAEFQAALGEARATGRATERLAAATRNLETQQPASNRYLAQSLCEAARLKIDTDPSDAREMADRCMQLRRDELEMSEWRIAEARAISLVARIEAGERSAVPELSDARKVISSAMGEKHPMLDWCDRWLENRDSARTAR